MYRKRGVQFDKSNIRLFSFCAFLFFFYNKKIETNKDILIVSYHLTHSDSLKRKSTIAYIEKDDSLSVTRSI